MTLTLDIPGAGRLELEHLLLDVNGTLTDRGSLLDGVGERLASLGNMLRVLLVSADTFGTLEGLAQELGAEGIRVDDGLQKLQLVERLGSERTTVIGNGANDALALEVARLGIVVLGPEGASTLAVGAADVVCASIIDALDLLLDERALLATLRR
jgi:soluble P-type ATPase